MISWDDLKGRPLQQKISMLYQHGTFVMSIRYYRYKINLYLLGSTYVEVFVNHKYSSIDKISPLDDRHSRMKFYSDQIKLPMW
ncbi:MAG: hypothetical protein MUC38_02800 [Cyclobacteriaceae bacterium]|jgi:hypothetical protein|nr:hypothetical protein [Cyclobacteriaceae bacterium]